MSIGSSLLLAIIEEHKENYSTMKVLTAQREIHGSTGLPQLLNHSCALDLEGLVAQVSSNSGKECEIVWI